MVLGDYFGEQAKRAHIHSHLVPGAVIYTFCKFTKPPKDKFLLVVQVQAETTVLVVNTSINQFIQDRQHLRDCQVPIDLASHDFLKHDSFIDCSATGSFNTAELIDEILGDMQKLKGSITELVKGNVINALNDCYTIEPNRISSIVASLNSTN